MSIVLQGSTSGSITLQEPAVAGTNTLSLPASTGTFLVQPTGAAITVPNATGTVILANASNNLQMNSGYGSDATAYGCRAWVNFNGTGTVAIRASGNVSSITDNGTGNYTINFTTALVDANYSSYGSCRPTAGGSPHYLFYVENRDSITRTTSALQIYLLNPTNQLSADAEVVSVSIIR